MRNLYTKEFEREFKILAPYFTLDELLVYAREFYDINISQLRQFFYKRNIKYKDYNINKVRDMGDKIPIGQERKKPDGMVQVKVAKNKWEYKQRLIYEQYYNVKLTSDDFIIFLDQNRNNFDIKNLKRITRHESAILSNQKMFSKNPEVTNLGVDVAKLMIETKKHSKNQF